MALRGDYQGGSAGQGILGAQGLGGGADGGNIAIEKYLKWSIAFFVGALVVFLVAVGTSIFWISNFTWAPATLFFEFFLLVFGLMMLVLDTPIPHMQNHKHIQHTRTQIYKFALFMTRFMGRGVWYLFLATMVFGSLWDTGINWVLGGICTAYLSILGTVAMGKGFLLSHKLNKVRELMRGAGHQAERYVSPGQDGLTGEQLKIMIDTVTSDKDYFSNDEIEYIINALSFTPFPDGKVNLEELQHWLQPGPPMMV